MKRKNLAKSSIVCALCLISLAGIFSTYIAVSSTATAKVPQRILNFVTWDSDRYFQLNWDTDSEKTTQAVDTYRVLKAPDSLENLNEISFSSPFGLPFGTDLGNFNGVTAFSNGSAGYYSGLSNLVNGHYTGIKWQCVEYMRRYYLSFYGIDLSSYHGNANTWYNNAALAGLDKYPNGGTVAPQVGDILASNGGKFGHVAIIRSVSSNQVCTIQQNYLNDTSDTNKCLTLSISGGIYTVSGYSGIQGWLRRIGATPPPCVSGTSVSFINGHTPIHPNGTLIKISGDPTYYVLIGGQKRGIASADVLHNLYGGENSEFEFNEVVTVSLNEFNSYPTGAVINSSLPSNGLSQPNGRLVKQVGGAEISIVSDGARHPFPSASMFTDLGYAFCNVIEIPDYNLYPVGPIVDGGSNCTFTAGQGASGSELVTFQNTFTVAGGQSVLGCPSQGVQSNGFTSFAGTVSHYQLCAVGDIEYLTNGGRAGQAYAIVNPLYSKWASLGFNSNNPLGYPISVLSAPGTSCFDTSHRYQSFEGGSLEHHLSGTLAGSVFEVHGAIHAKWTVKGFDSCPLGLPIADEANAQTSGATGSSGKVSQFEGGHIYWKNLAASAYEVHGAIDQLFAQMNNTASWLGFPTSDEYVSSGFARNDFEGGYITTLDGVNYQAFHYGCNAPGAFSLSSPSNGQSLSSTSSVNLTWQASANADTYDVYFGISSPPPFIANQTGTSRSVTVTPGQTYFWKVVARVNCNSSLTSTTATWSFLVQQTCNAPGAFSLSSPSNGQSLSSTSSVNLTWQGAANADTYDVYFGTSSSPPFIANQTGTSRSVTVTPGQTYFWKVVAKVNCNSSLTSTTSVWSFLVSVQSYTIIVNASPLAGGTVSGAGTFPDGSSRMVTATANSGYTFANWTESGGIVSSLASYTFTLNSNRNLVANFTVNTQLPNDNFANAQIISGNSGSIQGTNVGATKEAGEPNHAGNVGGKSVWYRWQAPNSGSSVITTAGSDFDTLLGVYTGSSVSGLTTIASNDDNPAGGVQSIVTFNVVGGTVYYIAVDGYSGATGNITLNWNVSGDPCGTSTPISIGQTLTGQLLPGDCTTLFTDGSFADFFSFSGTTGQQVAISLNSTDFNAYLVLFDPTGQLIASDDNGGGGTNARIPATSGFFTLSATGTYRIAANTYPNQTGNYSIALSGASTVSGLQYFPLNPPVRLLDTRSGQQLACSTPGTPITSGTTLTQVAIGACSAVPATARAVTGNVTAVTPSANGFLTLYPSDATQPFVANNNYRTDRPFLGNVFTVGLGNSDGAFKVYSSATADVIVDITGYYAPPMSGGLYFHPLPAPVRLLDTRLGQSACTMTGTPIQSGQELFQQGNGICTIPSTAKVLVGNATAVNPQARGNITIFQGNIGRPLITSGNYEAGLNLNSPFQAALSPTGQFRIYTSAQIDMVVDILGYYSLDQFDASGTGLLYKSLTPVRLLDTRVGATSGCFRPGFPFQHPTEYLLQARGTCTIDATAVAIIGNATVVTPATNGFLTLWPSNANKPFVATSNYLGGINFNRFFTVGFGTDGAFKLYASTTSTDLVLDVSGYFIP